MVRMTLVHLTRASISRENPLQSGQTFHFAQGGLHEWNRFPIGQILNGPSEQVTVFIRVGMSRRHRKRYNEDHRHGEEPINFDQP